MGGAPRKFKLLKKLFLLYFLGLLTFFHFVNPKRIVLIISNNLDKTKYKSVVNSPYKSHQTKGYKVLIKFLPTFGSKYPKLQIKKIRWLAFFKTNILRESLPKSDNK